MSKEKRTTQKLVNDWVAQTLRVKEHKKQLETTEKELEQITDALGCRLCPEDMMFDEKICLWTRINDVYEALLIVSREKGHHFTIRFREESARPQDGKKAPVDATTAGHGIK